MKAACITTVLASFLLLANAALADKVDLEASTFQWTGKKITGSHYGKVALKSAEVTHKAGVVASGVFVMDMASITVEDLEPGEYNKKLLGHLKSPDFFDVKNHPTATLVLDSPTGKGVIAGKLTIKGTTKPVLITYTAKSGTFSGTLTFDRTTFGIRYGSGSFFDNLGDKAINDEVTVAFSVKIAGASGW